MSKLFICLSIVFSLLIAPIAQASSINCFNDSCHNVSAEKDHHHNTDIQPDEHAQLDFDSEGNPHNGMTHNHSHHNHGSYFNPAYSGLELATLIEGTTTLAYWKDNFHSDRCVSPLLEPPSHA